MRVLAARFPDRERASVALGLLHRRLGIGPRDVEIAPLGIPGEASDNDTVLAGRFPEERTAEVAGLVRRAGGEIVANVDESRTRPRVLPAARTDSRAESLVHH